MKKQRLVFGVGITDIKCVDENGKLLKSYEKWKSILMRCYSPSYHKTHPTYINCTISKEWIYFSSFKEWFDSHYVEGLVLDKDMLQEGVENKVYSEETCIFIPQALNGFLTNKQCDNKSGFIGVCWDKTHKKWITHINIYNHETKKTNNSKHLGRFTNIEEANNAYKKAREIEAQKWRDVMKEKHNWSQDLLEKIK